jgi:hypothetical protein
MKNELLEEDRRNRDEFARNWNYDIDAMVAALQEMERHSYGRLVDRGKTPDGALPPNGRDADSADVQGI